MMRLFGVFAVHRRAAGFFEDHPRPPIWSAFTAWARLPASRRRSRCRITWRTSCGRGRRSKPLNLSSSDDVEQGSQHQYANKPFEQARVGVVQQDVGAEHERLNVSIGVGHQLAGCPWSVVGFFTGRPFAFITKRSPPTTDDGRLKTDHDKSKCHSTL